MEEEEERRREPASLEIHSNMHGSCWMRSAAGSLTAPRRSWRVTSRASTDNRRETPLCSPGHMPRPDPPTLPFDTSPPKLREVEEVIKKARSVSAPGPNGLPYKLYKNCPQVVKLLWRLMKTAWKNQQVPAEWQQAVGVFIPKEQSSCTGLEALPWCT